VTQCGILKRQNKFLLGQIPMRQLVKYIYILFIILLLPGFSQATLLSDSSCSHCLIKTHDLPSCCQKTATVAGGDTCHDTGVSKSPCPHGGICQGDNTTPQALTTLSACKTLECGVSSSFMFEHVVFSKNKKEAEVRPPPLLVSRDRYILNCSFLI
jgi:hypothetical protein